VCVCVCVCAVVPLNAVATAIQSNASTCMCSYVEFCECYITTLPCCLGTSVILKPLYTRQINP